MRRRATCRRYARRSQTWDGIICVERRPRRLAPETEVGGTTVAYYDEATDTTYSHLIDGATDRFTLAAPMGKWFAWNVLALDEGSKDFAASRLSFLPLD